MKKVVNLDQLAAKELEDFSITVQARFYDLFEILGTEGKLEMPFAKRLNEKLFEIRVKHQGQ